MTDVNYSYWAGVVDCDGCISIEKSVWHKRSRSPVYTLKVGLANTNYNIMEAFKNNTGATQKIVKRKIRSPKHKQSYGVKVFGKKAYLFLQKIKEYLIIKKERADLAMKFYLYMKPHQHGVKVIEEEQKERERMYLEMKKMNKRGRD